jgi:hypothetical protein
MEVGYLATPLGSREELDAGRFLPAVRNYTASYQDVMEWIVLSDNK